MQPMPRKNKTRNQRRKLGAMYIELAITRDTNEYVNENVTIEIAKALAIACLRQHEKDTDLLQLQAYTQTKPNEIKSQATAERGSAGPLNPSSIISRKETK